MFFKKKENSLIEKVDSKSDVSSKYEIPDTWMGKSIDGSMKKVLKDSSKNKNSSKNQSQLENYVSQREIVKQTAVEAGNILGKSVKKTIYYGYNAVSPLLYIPTMFRRVYTFSEDGSEREFNIPVMAVITVGANSIFHLILYGNSAQQSLIKTQIATNLASLGYEIIRHSYKKAKTKLENKIKDDTR